MDFDLFGLCLLAAYGGFGIGYLYRFLFKEPQEPELLVVSETREEKNYEHVHQQAGRRNKRKNDVPGHEEARTVSLVSGSVVHSGGSDQGRGEGGVENAGFVLTQREAGMPDDYDDDEADWAANDELGFVFQCAE